MYIRTGDTNKQMFLRRGVGRLGNGADNIQMGIYSTILFMIGGSSLARKTIYQGSSHAGGRGGGGLSHICPLQVCAVIKTPFCSDLCLRHSHPFLAWPVLKTTI